MPIIAEMDNKKWIYDIDVTVEQKRYNSETILLIFDHKEEIIVIQLIKAKEHSSNKLKDQIIIFFFQFVYIFTVSICKK